MASRRQKRVAELIREEVSKLILQELKDPRLGLVSVTYVDVTPDLRQARVYVSTLEPEARHEVLAALEHAAGFIRHELGGRVRLKFTPELLFRLDETLEQSLRINELLSQVSASAVPAEDSSMIHGEDSEK